MNRGIFKLGAGTAAVAMLTILGLSTPTTAHAGICNGTALPDFGLTGPGPLQGILNSLTTNPLGSSSVDVATDCEPDASDSVWQIGGSGGAFSVLIAEYAGFAGSNKVGIWDASDPYINQVELFAGSDTPGAAHLLSILADGSVVVDFVDTGIDFAGNAFGFYLDATEGNQSSDGFFYSDTSLNADGMDHMYVYKGEGDEIEIPPYIAGPWGPYEHLFAWEDLIGPCKTDSNTPTGSAHSDCDYTDFVFLVESVSYVPEPSSLAIVGIGLLGMGVASRRRTRKIR